MKATNRQTEVTDEQLLALNDFNKRLEAYYQTYSGVQRLYYERRSKQYTSVMEIEKVRIVTVATQIFFNVPRQATVSKSLLWAVVKR